MSQHDHGDFPPELSFVADQLRSHRYEASALELDQAKTRILKRAGGQRVARGGGMRKKSLLTAMIMVAAIGIGSSAALAVGGSNFRGLRFIVPSFSLPSFNFLLPGRGSQVTAPPAQSAAVAQYGDGCPNEDGIFAAICDRLDSTFDRISARADHAALFESILQDIGAIFARIEISPLS